MVTRVGYGPTANPMATDDKLLFPTYDCSPGKEAYDVFEERLLGNGGRSDDQGWSLADCLNRRDDGAVTPAGAPVGGGVPVLPAAGGGVATEKRRALRRKRLKESHSYLVRHISNETVKRVLMRAPYLGNGPDALTYIRTRCRTAAQTTDRQEIQGKWLGVTIAKDVGSKESTVVDLDLHLETVNAELDAAVRYSDEETAEKILKEIAAASRLFMVEATTELNAVEGVPGQPGVRRFQLAAPLGGGPRPRDKPNMVAHFHGLWSAAVRGRRRWGRGDLARRGRRVGRPRPHVRLGDTRFGLGPRPLIGCNEGLANDGPLARPDGARVDASLDGVEWLHRRRQLVVRPPRRLHRRCPPSCSSLARPPSRSRSASSSTRAARC